jgi:hypothetical protein
LRWEFILSTPNPDATAFQRKVYLGEETLEEAVAIPRTMLHGQTVHLGQSVSQKRR